MCTVELVRAAGVSQAHVCVLPEACRICGLPYEDMASHADDDISNGQTANALRPLCVEYNMVVVFGAMVKVADKVFNAAVVMNGQGEISGHYFKKHPTPGEIANGVTPGSSGQDNNGQHHIL